MKLRFECCRCFYVLRQKCCSEIALSHNLDQGLKQCMLNYFKTCCSKLVLSVRYIVRRKEKEVKRNVRNVERYHHIWENVRESVGMIRWSFGGTFERKVKRKKK